MSTNATDAPLAGTIRYWRNAAHGELRGNLTPEQREQLAVFLAEKLEAEGVYRKEG